MSGIRDTATVTLNVNGAQAKQIMADIEAKITQTKATIDNLKKSMADPKDIEKAKKQLRSYEKQLDEMRSATEGVDRALSNINLATPRQLNKALATLNKQLKDMVPGSEVWDSHVEKIRELKARLADIKDELGEQETLWGKFKNWATDVWPSIDLLSRGYDSVISGLREYVDAYASMDQEMANVRKFTGMTEEQVASLNEQFKTIDTRTSREQLNQLAQEAGRLGKTSEEDVLGFVRAADKINVALDDLGEGATLTLSKLTGIFGDEQRYGTEQSLLKVGSVINELSQNCSASAPYIAQFTQRMGGVGAQAKMTIPQIMGFAAVLDTNAQALEASSTALSQIIVRLYQDPAKYAKVAGLDAQEFGRLMREDANAALILFLETLQKSGGMDNLSPMFKDMGENGSRAIAALSTLATHIDQVKAQQEAANIAFEEGTSIDTEFAVQNGTVEASLEKCKNAANELRVELGTHLYPIMSHFLTTGAAILRILLNTIQFVIQHKAAVAALAAAVAGYIVIIKGELIVKKLRNALDTIHYGYLVLEAKATKALAVITEGMRLVYFKLTGQVGKAMVAQKAFNAACAATPWGAILTAVTAAVVAFKAFDDEVSNTIDTSSRLAEAQANAAQALADERSQLRVNISTIETFNGSRSEEQKLIDQLNQKYGAFFGQCQTLHDWYHTLTTAGDAYCNSIYQQILLEGKRQAALDMVAEANKKRAERVPYTDTEVLYEFIDNLKYLPSWDHLSWSEAKESVISSHRAERDRQADMMEAAAMQLMQEYEQEMANAPQRFNTVLPETPTPTSTPYVSHVLADKERKKQEQEARKSALQQKRELALAKQEYKDQMNAAKGNWEIGSAQNISDYGQGLKTYEEFLAEKERLDLKYLDDRIAIYNSLYEGESEQDKKLLLMYDEDYQEFLMKRAELTNKHKAAEAKRKVEDLQREYKMEVAAAEFEFNSPNSRYYGNAQAQQERLFDLKVEYLEKYKKQYQEGSKEWTEYERQIQETEQERILQKRKTLMEKYEEFANTYTTISAKRRYEIELALVNELYEKKKITEQQYQLWLAQLREKYGQEAAAAETAASDAQFKVNAPGGKKVDVRSGKDQVKERVESLNRQRNAAIAELQERFNKGLIDEKQLQKGLKEVNSAYQDELFDPVRQGLDEQTRMLLDLGLAWADFFRSISENGQLTWDNIEDIAKNSVAVLCAGLQTYSQFLEAQSRIDQANVKKRYDKEIEAAQGNSYKTQKLEKKKEEELQKVKSEYARKEFAVKVIMAVAQTAQNALLGYAAGLQAGFPMALWLAPTLAGLAAAQGAVQIALLKKQQQAAQAEGYAEGGFTGKGGKYEPAGIVHKGEWVASQELLANPVARPMIEALDQAQRTNTIGSLRAEDVSRSITANNSLVRIAESDNGSLVMAAVASQMSAAVSDLTDRLREPFYTMNSVTGDYGMKQAQDEYTRLMNNVTPKSKRKS
ncbi:MAG: phage tail tape measure protein [Muribaculum sp.]|nr:phage tail tape measure protein [Muribaculum sp.]